MAAELKRVDIGFKGGQVLGVRVLDDEYQRLRKALANDGSERWFELRTQDSEVALDLSHVVYAQLDTEEHRVGF